METLFTKFLILHLTIVSCFICTSKSKVKLQMSKPPGILNVWPFGMIFTFTCRPTSPCSRVWEPPGRLEVFCKTFGAQMLVEFHVWNWAAVSAMQFSMIGLMHITWNFQIIQTVNSIEHISTWNMKKVILSVLFNVKTSQLRILQGFWGLHSGHYFGKVL